MYVYARTLLAQGFPAVFIFLFSGSFHIALALGSLKYFRVLFSSPIFLINFKICVNIVLF